MPGGQLHIGWSQIEITPPKKTLLLGQFYARLGKYRNQPTNSHRTRSRNPYTGRQSGAGNLPLLRFGSGRILSPICVRNLPVVAWGSTSTNSPSMPPTRTMRRPYAPGCTRSPRMTRTS